jgi:hypothetical protein
MSVVEERAQKLKNAHSLTVLDGMLSELMREPGLLEDPVRMETLMHAIRLSYPDSMRFIIKRLYKERHRWEELAAALKALQTEAVDLAWVLTKEFRLNGGSERFVYALGLGRPEVPQLLRVLDRTAEDDAEGETALPVEMPSPPFLGLVESKTKLLVGPAPQTPAPPMTAQTSEARAVTPQAAGEGLWEIEIVEGPEERVCTIRAAKELACDVKERLARGERVRVRIECGLATAIHSSDSERQSEFVETIDPAGPSVKDLVLPSALRRQWERDIACIALGRSVRVLLTGPTGTGKTTAVERVGRDAFQRRIHAGAPCKGIRLVRVSSQDIGSSYIHATERNLKRAMRMAADLHRDGYIVVILLDEGDQMLGEMTGAEHAHNRSERLALQALLSEDLPVAVYVTCNPRHNSWLPAPIERRFTKRVYGRPTRRQIEEVARFYIGAHPDVLKLFNLSASEFAGRVADNLFSDQRTVAICYLYSGNKLFIRARDLQTCAPGKIKQLIETFCCDVADGRSKGLENLWDLFDQEFQAPGLSVRNVHDVTFLPPLHDDTIRTIELAR